jgi:hypothetical protein
MFVFLDENLVEFKEGKIEMVSTPKTGQSLNPSKEG